MFPIIFLDDWISKFQRPRFQRIAAMYDSVLLLRGILNTLGQTLIEIHMRRIETRNRRGVIFEDAIE